MAIVHRSLLFFFSLALLLGSSIDTLAQEKIPLLVNIRTKADKKYVGEVLQRNDDSVVLFDIVLRDTVTIVTDQVKSIVEGINEARASGHVPFPTYAAWKLTKLLKVGKIQGNVALVSDQGIFINLGEAAGVKQGQTVKLLGDAEVIKDPETDEVLGVFRPTNAMLEVVEVLNDRLSKVTLANPNVPVQINRGMLVECDRDSVTIVVVPPRWKSEDSNLKTADEALFLTEHILTELVGYGVPVISRDQVDLALTELSEQSGKPKISIPAALVADRLKADILVTGQILAKGVTGNITLHVTEVKSKLYVGVLAGRIRRDTVQAVAKAATDREIMIRRRINNLPPLAAEMLRRKEIAKKLIEAGVRVILKVPNGASVTYKNKQLPDPDVGFPPVFGFEQVQFFDEVSVAALPLLSDVSVQTLFFKMPSSNAEYFSVLPQIPVKDIGFYLPIEDSHLPRLPKTVQFLRFGDSSLVTTQALARQQLRLERFRGGGGVGIAEMPGLHRLFRFSILEIARSNLKPNWPSFVPCPGLYFVEFDTETLELAVADLKASEYFARKMAQFNFLYPNEIKSQDCDRLIGQLFLVGAKRAAVVRTVRFGQGTLSANLVQRLQVAYPNVKFVGL